MCFKLKSKFQISKKTFPFGTFENGMNYIMRIDFSIRDAGNYVQSAYKYIISSVGIIHPSEMSEMIASIVCRHIFNIPKSFTKFRKLLDSTNFWFVCNSETHENQKELKKTEKDSNSNISKNFHALKF